MDERDLSQWNDEEVCNLLTTFIGHRINSFMYSHGRRCWMNSLPGKRNGDSLTVKETFPWYEETTGYSEAPGSSALSLVLPLLPISCCIRLDRPGSCPLSYISFNIIP
jgi:hypothetical protein